MPTRWLVSLSVSVEGEDDENAIDLLGQLIDAAETTKGTKPRIEGYTATRLEGIAPFVQTPGA